MLMNFAKNAYRHIAKKPLNTSNTGIHAIKKKWETW